MSFHIMGHAGPPTDNCLEGPTPTNMRQVLTWTAQWRAVLKSLSTRVGSAPFFSSICVCWGWLWKAAQCSGVIPYKTIIRGRRDEHWLGRKGTQKDGTQFPLDWRPSLQTPLAPCQATHSWLFVEVLFGAQHMGTEKILVTKIKWVPALRGNCSGAEEQLISNTYKQPSKLLNALGSSMDKVPQLCNFELFAVAVSQPEHVSVPLVS